LIKNRAITTISCKLQEADISALDKPQTDLTRGAVYTHIGDLLRYHRLIMRQSQTQIAQLIGGSPQQYQKYESGQSKCPIDALLKLCQHYQIAVEMLFPPEAIQSEPPQSESPQASEPAEMPMRARMPPAPADIDAPELARLIAAYGQISDRMKRLKLIELIEMQ
jgi:transcriptional regulator with XRE-family HTH domain